ncbi:MAG TPA: hypothetical protein PKW54_05465, partial [Ferruginibacter sp.]|nr:hypothetical protein [Ferruginibacter sp.]
RVMKARPAIVFTCMCNGFNKKIDFIPKVNKYALIIEPLCRKWDEWFKAQFLFYQFLPVLR